MSKRNLMLIIIALLITNLSTLIYFNNSEKPHQSKSNDDQDGGNLDQHVARIDDEIIEYDEWIEALTTEFGKQSLKRLIDRRVVNQLAEEKNINISDKVIERELSLLMTTSGALSEEDAEEMKETWREELIYRYHLEALLTENVSVLEDEILSFYNTYKNQYNFSSSVQLSHIIVPSMDIAEQVVRDLEDGASFQLLAKEYSIDEDTKHQGGYLGYFMKTSRFVPQGYLDIVADMDEHSYSEPFQTADGVVILYLHHVLPSIEFTYDELKDHIRNELALRKAGLTLDASLLWEQFDIEWIYD